MHKNVDVSVVLPCLNEETTIGPCVRQIREVFQRERISGEIIVVDNGSTDRSLEIARNEGAVVFEEARRGYGAAYLRGLREATGAYIVMGDSDGTYDFNDIPRFVQALRGGSDFVMGSRFRGAMEKGAMPWANRWLGNPVLSGICRLFFRTSLSDIHCGMRALTKSASNRMKLRSPGMEFATEMVVSALHNKLSISEIPIDYHVRGGRSKLNPVFDAWRHVRFMLIYAPIWLYFVPGTAGFITGSAILAVLMRGPILFLGHQWDVHMMIYASALAILSYQIFSIGVYVHTFAIRKEILRYDALTLFFKRHFSLERGMALGGVVFLVGFSIFISIFISWFKTHFGAMDRLREAIVAMTLVVIGLQTVFSSFFISFLYLEGE